MMVAYWYLGDKSFHQLFMIGFNKLMGIVNLVLQTMVTLIKEEEENIKKL